MNNQTELMVPEPAGPLAVVPASPMELIALAVQKGADVGTLERLTDLAERFDRKRAKQEFDAAMAAFQAECPVILKTVAGAKGNYKFAPLDHIVFQTRGLLEKHGFSYRLSSEVTEGWVKAMIAVTHRAGHVETSEFKVPVDSRNTLMSDPQRYGGSMTFSKRYAFANAFGILTADEDKDGQTAQAKTGLRARLAAERAQSPQDRTDAAVPPAIFGGGEVKALKGRLWLLLAPVRGDANTWEQATLWLRQKKILPEKMRIADLTESDLLEAIEKTEIELSQ